MTILDVIGWVVLVCFIVSGLFVAWSIWASYQFERQRKTWRDDEPYEGRHVLDDE
jgi:hypothetical protein